MLSPNTQYVLAAWALVALIGALAAFGGSADAMARAFGRSRDDRYFHSHSPPTVPPVNASSPVARALADPMAAARGPKLAGTDGAPVAATVVTAVCGFTAAAGLLSTCTAYSAWEVRERAEAERERVPLEPVLSKKSGLGASLAATQRTPTPHSQPQLARLLRPGRTNPTPPLASIRISVAAGGEP